MYTDTVSNKTISCFERERGGEREGGRERERERKRKKERERERGGE